MIAPAADEHGGMRVGATLLGTAVIAVGLLAGCAADSAEPVTADPCARRITEAAAAIDIDDQVRVLDEAMYVCRTLDEFTAGVADHPGLMAVEPVVFLARRCVRSEIAAVRESPICDTEAVNALIAPATVGPPGTVPADVAAAAEPVYLGETLDGRTVEIVPDADTPFVDGRPQVIVRMVDLAFSDGCDGLLDEREYWSGRAGDPDIGDEASVYARHAISLMEFIDCDMAADEPVPDTTPEPDDPTSEDPTPDESTIDGDDGSAD